MSKVSIVALMKRNPRLTPQEFRERYENVECKRVETTFGHLILSYQRNYPQSAFEAKSKGAAPAYDCVTVMTFASIDDYQKMVAMRDSSSGINSEVDAARARLFDVPALEMLLCDSSLSDNIGSAARG